MDIESFVLAVEGDDMDMDFFDEEDGEEANLFHDPEEEEGSASDEWTDEDHGGDEDEDEEDDEDDGDDFVYELGDRWSSVGFDLDFLVQHETTSSVFQTGRDVVQWYFTYTAKSSSWNRGVLMASRRKQILLPVFLLCVICPMRLATVSTQALCPMFLNWTAKARAQKVYFVFNLKLTPNMSFFLKFLRDEEVVTRKKQGKSANWRFF